MEPPLTAAGIYIQELAEKFRLSRRFSGAAIVKIAWDAQIARLDTARPGLPIESLL
jgi:hypothetical protein